MSSAAPLYATDIWRLASESAPAPLTSGRPGAAPMLIAMSSETVRPVVPPGVIAPHVAVSGYVTAAAWHVTVMLTVRPGVVRPVYGLGPWFVKPAGRLPSVILPAFGTVGTLATEYAPAPDVVAAGSAPLPVGVTVTVAPAIPPPRLLDTVPLIVPVGTWQVTVKFAVDVAPDVTVTVCAEGATQPAGRFASETVREPVATFPIEYAPVAAVVPVKPPETLTVTLFKGPSCGDVTLPLIVPGFGVVVDWRSPATIIFTRKSPTVGSTRKPTVCDVDAPSGAIVPNDS